MALWREHEFLLEAWASHDPQVVRQATQQHLEVGLYRVKLSQQQTPHEGGATDRAAAFLSTHYASEISIEWVAHNIAFISTSQLTRRFQSELGLSPYAWLRQVRMEQAALLLRSGKDTIAAIGKKTGYTNASHFSRDFRSHFGTTPRQYRQSNPS